MVIVKPEVGMRVFKRMESDERIGKRPVNRPDWRGSKTRCLRKLVGKKNWFKVRKDGKKGH